MKHHRQTPVVGMVHSMLLHERCLERDTDLRGYEAYLIQEDGSLETVTSPSRLR